jgi:hypothetical protein
MPPPSKDVPSEATHAALRVAVAERGRGWSDWTVGYRRWWALLWCEWFSRSHFTLSFIVAWLLGVWGLPFVANPGWLLVLGIVYAFLAAPLYGGDDVMEGCEEFTLSLPTSRRERYLARMLTGLGSLLFLTGLNCLALGLDFSQALAKLYLISGLARPSEVLRSGLMSGLVWAFPICVFSGGFAMAALARTRLQVVAAPFWGAILAMLILRGGFDVESLLWEKITGLVTCPLLVAGGAISLAAGGFGFERKEIAQGGGRLQLPLHWWVWAALLITGILLMAFLADWLTQELSGFLTGV